MRDGERTSPDGGGRAVLVVEDEREVMRFLRATLPAHGYRLLEASSGREGLLQARTRVPQLVLLDLGLPDMEGVEVAREIRTWSPVPIIVISARGQERDKIEALDAGADDYLTKPFGVGELLARMRVAVRLAARVPGAADSVFETGGLRVDLSSRRVWVRQEEIHLTRTQFGLLAELVRHAGRVLTHKHLLRAVWGPGVTAQHYVRVYMAQLRHKLEDDPARPEYLVTETGVGYRLRSD